MLWPGTAYGHLKPALPPALTPSSGDCLAISEGWIPLATHNYQTENSYQPPRREWQLGCSTGITTDTSIRNRALHPFVFATCSWFHRQHLESARKSAPEGYFGSLVMQSNCTQVVQGLNRLPPGNSQVIDQPPNYWKWKKSRLPMRPGCHDPPHHSWAEFIWSDSERENLPLPSMKFHWSGIYHPGREWHFKLL